jgi:hypothetical protein
MRVTSVRWNLISSLVQLFTPDQRGSSLKLVLLLVSLIMVLEADSSSTASTAI